VKLDIKAGRIHNLVAVERSDSRDVNDDALEPARRHRILFVCAGPDGAPNLHIDRELRVVSDAVARSSSLDVEVLYRTSRHDLRRRLLNHDFELLHFSCHGTEHGLLLEGEYGTPALLEGRDLLGFLRANLDASKLRALVFNACWSASIAAAAAPHFRRVVGVNGPVDAVAATEFSMGFYDAFVAGRSIKHACEEGGRCVRSSPAKAGFELVLYESGRRFRFRA
jgi:hypothetical protein